MGKSRPRFNFVDWDLLLLIYGYILLAVQINLSPSSKPFVESLMAHRRNIDSLQVRPEAPN
jgi:di/tricarboxylate transporter